MELQTISEVSKHFNISTRTLRYYEQIGLIQPVKRDDFAYRTYDEETILRLKQIIVLRKIRIPLKQIVEILKSEDTVVAINAFQQNLNEIEDEITALTTIKNIIKTLLEQLHLESDGLRLLDDESLLEIVDSLTVSKINFKEDKAIGDLNKASEKLNKLTDKDVRIVYLPPATVAAYQYEGENPEGHCQQIVETFVRENNLHQIKPDLRHYGFKSPNFANNANYHGYEMWVTINYDFEVPAPFVKKHFVGGLYAAHMIQFGAFEEWDWLFKWVQDNKNYDYRGERNGENQGGCMEEQLNYVNRVCLTDTQADVLQLDLFVPIKPKFAATTKHPQERIIDTFKYNDMPVEVVEWDETIWCGKIGYQGETTNDPNVDWVQPILDGYFALDISTAKERIEPDWAVCINLNHLTSERPNGVMFADLVGTENQPDGFDIYKVPSGQYLRLAINNDSAKALGSQPWEGGMPPFEWVGEQLAPQFGYTYGDDRLPVFEYYGYYNTEKNVHEFCYLYVPVKKYRMFLNHITSDQADAK